VASYAGAEPGPGSNQLQARPGTVVQDDDVLSGEAKLPAAVTSLGAGSDEVKVTTMHMEVPIGWEMRPFDHAKGEVEGAPLSPSPYVDIDEGPPTPSSPLVTVVHERPGPGLGPDHISVEAIIPPPVSAAGYALRLEGNLRRRESENPGKAGPGGSDQVAERHWAAFVRNYAVRIQAVYEADNECNKIPRPQQRTDSCLFIAAEDSADTINAKISHQITPASMQPQLRWQLVKYATLEPVAGGPIASTGNVTEVTFSATGHQEILLLWIGHDSNADGVVNMAEMNQDRLDSSDEVIYLVTFTHDGRSNSRSELAAQADLVAPIFPIAATCLNAFATEPIGPFDPLKHLDTIVCGDSRLTHGAGEGDFDELNKAIRLEFDEEDIVDKVVDSVGMNVVIGKILKAHKSEIEEYFDDNPTAVSHRFTFQNEAYGFSFPTTDPDLFLAFHSARLEVDSVIIDVRLGVVTEMFAEYIEIDGKIVDLYDFNYESIEDGVAGAGPGAASLTNAVSEDGLVQHAAIVQIGHEPPALQLSFAEPGQIYKAEIPLKDIQYGDAYYFDD